MRTEADRNQIAKECVKVEKAGGDVLTNENVAQKINEKAREMVSKDLQDMRSREEKIRKDPELMKKAVKKVQELAAAADDHAQKASPTCCQPAKPSGVTVPDELPEEPSLEIAAVRSAVCDGYKYERVFGIGNQDNVALVWRDPVCRGENSLIFSVNNWLQIAKEIPQMLKQLGLI